MNKKELLKSLKKKYVILKEKSSFLIKIRSK